MNPVSPHRPADSPDLSIKAKPVVLIVDDLPENLQVLAGYLSEMGCDVIPADSGARALAILADCRPDLILLDIVMPKMDGFSVCQQIKQRDELAEIPVVFLTARVEPADVVRGLELGAVDYVTKPFNPAELKARARVHLELKASRDLLLAYNQKLQCLTDELRQMNEDKNRLLGFVSHDIRGAFANVISVSELVSDWRQENPERCGEMLQDLGMEAEHMISLAENLLNIDMIEHGGMKLDVQRVAVRPLIDFAIHSHQIAARGNQLRFEIRGDEKFVYGDLTACRQILTNLVSNAVKHSPTGGTILLEMAGTPDQFVTLSVQDAGAGMTPEIQKRLFHPFQRDRSDTLSREHLMGLGLAIVKQMTEAMGGKVGCESSPGQGSRFFFTLPEAFEFE